MKHLINNKHVSQGKVQLPDDYFALVKLWANYDYASVPADYQLMLQANLALARVLNQSPCVTRILDLRTQRFDFVSSNSTEILGFEPGNFTSQGLEFCNELFHPDDLPTTWKLIRNIWEMISNVEPYRRADYKFNYDYRIIKENGKQARILEQNSVLQQDSRGNITHVLCVCTDITNWKKTDDQVGSIISIVDNSCLFLTTDLTDACCDKAILSKRELEIVRLMADGYSSKYIAEKLFISFHTVNTHRQKIIGKTKTRNTGELVQFAICNGLI